jgi:hypothetical protein
MVLNLVIIAVALVVMLVLDILALSTKIGLLFIGAGVIGVYTTALIFSTGNASTAIQWGSIILSVQDANLILAICSVFTVLSFSMILLLRWKVEGGGAF